MRFPELASLARPFPPSLIKTKPGGFSADYVAHAHVVEKLLAQHGPYSFEVLHAIRDDVNGPVTGCLARLSLVVDGREVVITEAGDCERPDNWPSDGARLKNAASDALKRCAMRVGVGLHLWCHQNYRLHALLTQEEDSEQGNAGLDRA